jgi:hypothetical protein
MQDTPGTALPIEAFATLARADLVEAHEACKSANTMLLYEVDAIAAIKQERDALRAEVERLTAYNATRTDELAASVKQCSALKAEAESLRAACDKFSEAEMLMKRGGV